MPSSREETAAAVALLRLIGLGHPGAADLLEERDVRHTLEESLGAATSLLPEDPEGRLLRARSELDDWTRRGYAPLTVRDTAYPDALRSVHDRPAMLFVAGDPKLVRARTGIAIVGSRDASPPGRARAERIAGDLVDAGHVVVSGMAAGIDAAAHRAAIDRGGRTVAVVGTGLDTVYPRGHVRLHAELVRGHAVVSPFWPESPPAAERFRLRNGVMSGLSLGTIIAEASERSGTRVQARLALAHGRPVFLAEELLSQRWASDLAERPGVHVIASAADVLAVLVRSAGAPSG